MKRIWHIVRPFLAAILVLVGLLALILIPALSTSKNVAPHFAALSGAARNVTPSEQQTLAPLPGDIEPLPEGAEVPGGDLDPGLLPRNQRRRADRRDAKRRLPVRRLPRIPDRAERRLHLQGGGELPERLLRQQRRAQRHVRGGRGTGEHGADHRRSVRGQDRPDQRASRCGDEPRQPERQQRLRRRQQPQHPRRREHRRRVEPQDRVARSRHRRDHQGARPARPGPGQAGGHQLQGADRRARRHDHPPQPEPSRELQPAGRRRTGGLLAVRRRARAEAVGHARDRSQTR